VVWLCCVQTAQTNEKSVLSFEKDSRADEIAESRNRWSEDNLELYVAPNDTMREVLCDLILLTCGAKWTNWNNGIVRDFATCVVKHSTNRSIGWKPESPGTHALIETYGTLKH
jgi:hypothetical protein